MAGEYTNAWQRDWDELLFCIWCPTAIILLSSHPYAEHFNIVVLPVKRNTQSGFRMLIAATFLSIPVDLSTLADAKHSLVTPAALPSAKLWCCYCNPSFCSHHPRYKYAVPPRSSSQSGLPDKCHLAKTQKGRRLVLDLAIQQSAAPFNQEDNKPNLFRP